LTGTSSAISQFFDSQGNIIASGLQEADTGTAFAHRYSMPEGIELFKDVKYAYYPVFGKTFSELVSSSEENGPYDTKEKKRFPAKTVWKVGWTYRYVSTSPLEEDRMMHVAVEIHDIVFHDDITVTLPTVLDSTVLTPVEKSLWENYLQKLLKAEHTMVDRIRDPVMRDELIRRFESIDYLIFEDRGRLPVDQTIERLIEEETFKIGREWIEKIKP
jgi:hypothetical protein